MGGRIDKGKKTYFSGTPVCLVSVVNQRIRIKKKHFVKINSDLVRKLPAAGCFTISCETLGADVWRRTVGVISNLIKSKRSSFSKADRGLHRGLKGAALEAGNTGIKNFPSKKAGFETVPAFF